MACIPASDSMPSSYCPSRADAEKILGQKAILKESSSETMGGRTQYKCTYMATQADPVKGVTGNLFFMLESYTTTIAAMNAYTNIIESNKNMPGQTTLKGLGDAALLHTDEKNFMMVVCRKGNKLLRVKINKITSYTSKEELMRFVKGYDFR
jgi:hypothetical protein